MLNIFFSILHFMNARPIEPPEGKDVAMKPAREGSRPAQYRVEARWGSSIYTLCTERFSYISSNLKVATQWWGGVRFPNSCKIGLQI